MTLESVIAAVLEEFREHGALDYANTPSFGRSFVTVG
jgi:hypothetical protein